MRRQPIDVALSLFLPSPIFVSESNEKMSLGEDKNNEKESLRALKRIGSGKYREMFSVTLL